MILDGNCRLSDMWRIQLKPNPSDAQHQSPHKPEWEEVREMIGGILSELEGNVLMDYWTGWRRQGRGINGASAPSLTRPRREQLGTGCAGSWSFHPRVPE